MVTEWLRYLHYRNGLGIGVHTEMYLIVTDVYSNSMWYTLVKWFTLIEIRLVMLIYVFG